MNRPVYKLFMNELRQALNDHDPIGLIGLGAPETEYDLERGMIALKLRKCQSVDDVQRMIHGVFVDCFTRRTAGSKRRYRRLADAIWNVWNEFEPARGGGTSAQATD